MTPEMFVDVNRQRELILLAREGYIASAIREAILDGAAGSGAGEAVQARESVDLDVVSHKKIRVLMRGLAELIDGVEIGLIDPKELGNLPSRLARFCVTQAHSAKQETR